MSKKEIVTEQAPKAIGPYSQAIESEGLLFVSGQIPLNPLTGQLVENNIKNQTEQVLKNINAILTEAGLSFSNVLKSTVYLKNMSDFSEFNEVYASFFSAPYPARATVEVARLPKDVLVEIEVIARR